jgi:ABC-type iron transport system FetAB ATPase subunit
MKLQFHTTFASIKDFPEIDLPSFTLITGLNGTGKSHVLRAIKEGRLRNNITTNHDSEIRLYDWTNLAPNNSATYDSRQWINQRSSAKDAVQSHIRELGGQVIDAARIAGIPSSHLKDATYVCSLSLVELTHILGDREKAKLAATSISAAAEKVSKQIASKIAANQKVRETIASISRASGKPIVAIEDKDYYIDTHDRWGAVDMFQQSLAQLFAAYRDLALRNELRLRARERGRETEALSASEFIEKHMIAPWAFVNETLQAAHLDFEIDHPDLDDYVPYHPKLTKRSTGAQIFFPDLSSGEKILMSLALCLYYTEDKRQITTYPKILLLDEVDAPLHPSMAKFYLDVLIRTVVEKNNITVVATTHSPSTVAIAPENSLYVIEPGKPGLQKTTKSRALNILTDGVPTLAISFEGRRQVFVESPNDAKLYDAINQTLKAQIRSDRSLEFVATGIKNPSSQEHLNTGCEVVRHLVQTLCKSGNNSVFGLIDWDGKNNPDSRLVVLAHGKRNGIENVIMDPLLLAAFIVGYDRQSAVSLDVNPNSTYPDFLKFTPTELQPIVDSLERKVFANPGVKEICKYVGGFELQICERFLREDDHKLEQAVLNAFPKLNAYAKRSGALLFEIATTALKDQPSFAPVEILNAYADLLEKESH